MKNKKNNKNFIVFLLIGLLFFLKVNHVVASERIGILASRRITPYMTMVDGLMENIDNPSQLFFLNDRGGVESEYGTLIEWNNYKFPLIVAVGPEALSYVSTMKSTIPIIYGMVLDPNITTTNSSPISGITLDIFSVGQLDLVSLIFPDIKRIGVLYNPENNSPWLSSAIFRGPGNGVSIIPLSVSDRSKIAEIFKKNIFTIDALLFVPDSTVISKTIIRYIIKEGIYRGVPAIGYNSFFHDSGAALSFIIDYKEVGHQVADLVKAKLQGKPVFSVGPRYKVILNKKVVDLLKLKINQNMPEFVKFQ